ncbi:MAG: TIR domain-containing protein [Eubacteriales bacterium]|nr:TIR domain-containing protein [Eubacteriales bacterium]
MGSDQKTRIKTDEMEKAASTFKDDRKYKFDAFISYRHVEPDQSIAQELHRLIETFKAPKEFETDGQRLSFRVFRDREELAARDLSTSIKDALQNSHYLIVLCSKRTPLSLWCQKEIELFRSYHGDERIIPVLIEGEVWESFPETLKNLKLQDNDEGLQDILAADIRANEVLQDDFAGYEYLQENHSEKLKKLTKESIALLKTEKYRIMATILGCTFGDLKQRDKERKNKLIVRLSVLSGAVFLVFGLFMANAYRNAEAARQEAVQSNAAILMNTSKDLQKEGDTIKSILVAKEAMKPITASMTNYDFLKAEEQAIFNDSIYHSGASMLTSIDTKNQLTFFDISNDGKYIAYGLENDKTAIADSQNGQVLKTFSGHAEQVKLLDFSPDNRFLASASFDETIAVHDVLNDSEAARLDFTGIPMMMEFSATGDKLVILSFNNKSTVITVFSTEDWKKSSELEIDELIDYADLNADASEILMLLKKDVDNQVTRRNIATGEIIYAYPKIRKQLSDGSAYNSLYTFCRYSNDKESVILATEDEIFKYHLADGEKVFNEAYNLRNMDRKPIVETKSGDRLLINAAAQINIIDGRSGTPLNSIFFEDILPEIFSYNETTNSIIVFNEEGEFSIWQDGIVRDNKIKYGRGIPTELEFLPDGSKVIVNSHENQTIKTIDMESKISLAPIKAQILSASADSSKLLLFDGRDLFKSSDNGVTLEKLELEDFMFDGFAQDTLKYIISNDGNYFAYVEYNDDSNSEFKFVVRLFDLANQTIAKIPLKTAKVALIFTQDSKNIITLDDIDGLKMYDVADAKMVKEYGAIRDNSGKMILSADSNILVLNKVLSGTASLFDLNSGELIDNIPGEALYIENKEDEIIVRGIQNNFAYIWSNKKDIVKIKLDEATEQTPLSLHDINLYNRNSDIMLLIRNNETERICYVINFQTGSLMMSFKPSIKKYDVNGYLSTDGKTIITDQNFYVKYDAKDPDQNINERTAAVYKLLEEEEVEKIIDQILGDRELTEEEKAQIGIRVKQRDQ